MKEFTILGRNFELLTRDSQWEKLHDYLNQYLLGNSWGQYAVILMLAVLAGFLLSLLLHGMAKKAVNILLVLAYTGALVLLFVVGRETARGFRMFDLSDYLTATGFHETRVLIAVVNCMMFIPFGILLRKASGRRSFFTNLLLTVFLAGGIEMAQYVFSKGYTALEDAALYVLGAFAGMILAAPFCLISEFFENRRRKKKHPTRSADNRKPVRKRSERRYRGSDEEDYSGYGDDGYGYDSEGVSNDSDRFDAEAVYRDARGNNPETEYEDAEGYEDARDYRSEYEVEDDRYYSEAAYEEARDYRPEYETGDDGYFSEEYDSGEQWKDSLPNVEDEEYYLDEYDEEDMEEDRY